MIPPSSSSSDEPPVQSHNATLSFGTVPAARNNNLVAESDLRVAVAAVTNYFEQRSMIHHQDVIINNNDDLQQHQQQQQQQRLYQDCARSLTCKLEQVVQPVADEAFHTYVARHRDDWMASADDWIASSSSMNEDTADGTAQQEAEQHEQHHEQQHDDDDECLLDQAALARVRELRNRVRAQAAVIAAVRTATLQRSVAVVERTWQNRGLLLNSGSRSSSTTTTTLAATSQEQSPNNDSIQLLVQDYKAEMLQMKSAVESMHAALQETGTRVPPQLRRFQTTIHDIEQAMMQQQQQNMSQPLSQIEQAIYNRDHSNYGDEEDVLEGPMAPEQRLANLLCSD